MKFDCMPDSDMKASITVDRSDVLHGSRSHLAQALRPSTLTEGFMPGYCGLPLEILCGLRFATGDSPGGYCGLPLEILPLTSNCFKFGKHPCSKFDEYYDLHTLPCSDAIQQDILISSGVWNLSCQF